MEDLRTLSAQRLAFFGSPGSFTEEAALAFAERHDLARDAARWLGTSEPAGVLAALRSGVADLGVLPIVNTSAGAVRASLAALCSGDGELVDELELPVHIALWSARSGIATADIERVASHPHALAQCARSLARLLPGCERLEYADTASAARALAAGTLGAHVAVLASERAGRRYGLSLLARDVQDDPNNRTFFVLLRRRDL